MLATSREQLGVPGETAWRVPSLSFPSAHEARLDALKQYEAVQLFVERARKVRPNFTIDDTTVAPVAAICHRLDGIPLAIELAAARTRVLSPQQILDGLDDRFRLLTGGARTAVARQQTLRGVGRLELRAADRCRANIVRAVFRYSPVASRSTPPKSSQVPIPSARSRCWICCRALPIGRCWS